MSVRNIQNDRHEPSRMRWLVACPGPLQESNLDPLANFLISFAASIGANLTTGAVNAVVEQFKAEKPECAQRLTHPKSEKEFNDALKDLSSTMKALAGSGTIAIDDVVITSLGQAHFDHQAGQVWIGNSKIEAPIVKTGGSGPGQTIIEQNTSLHSKGTKIDVGQGGTIAIVGDGSITQT